MLTGKQSRDIHLAGGTPLQVSLRRFFEISPARCTVFDATWPGNMPHRAFWDRSAGQVNVTGLDFAESDFAVSDYASFCPASSGISHMQHLALPQVTLFHILIGNWFRSVSFPPTSIPAPQPE